MKVDRLISIILLLLDKKRIGAQELAETFEVSSRTIYRDIDAISMAGVPVRSIPGVSGGFEIMPNYKVDSKVFSAADLSAILMGLSGLSNLMRGDELVNALAKVKSFIPAGKAKEIERGANQIHIDLSPWAGNGNIQPYFSRIQTALTESLLLRFEYADRYGNKTARTVEPYQLVLKGNRWYVYAYCREREDYRLFRLSRMTNLQITEEAFTPRDYPAPMLDFTEMLESMQTKIKLRIHKAVMEMALDYCQIDLFTPDGEDYYIIHFPFIENDYYYGILLSFGDKCECLEPEHVRAELGRRAQNIATVYKE
jgi:predicted DNA-binding transcriptional regulator YafY